MALKLYNPDTPSKRGLILDDRSGLYKGSPLKSLTVGLKSNGGRNNHGRITVRHQGGGHKKSYRKVDFKRDKFDIYATVERLEYDPNRTAYIALIKYDDGEYSYILAAQKMLVGDRIVSSSDADIKAGNTLPLSKIPVGIMVHNIEMRPGKGGQLGRAAGSYAQVVGKDSGYVMLKLRSGEVRLIKAECLATIGVLSNADNQNKSYGKAGRMRWLGCRPTVRGVAMNPIDHPHGGGEGKTSGGRHPVTPWGKPTKGKKTRKNKRTQRYIVRSRHSK